MSFIFNDAHVFSAQDYQDFVDRKKLDLVFNQSNGFSGLTHTTKHVIFNNDRHVGHACVSIPIEKCEGLFAALVSGRRACNVPIPDLFRTIEGLTKVEFDKGRILAHHGRKNRQGQSDSTMSWEARGLDTSHSQALVKMSRGEVATVFGSITPVSCGVQLMGTVLRSDGVHLFIGAEAKEPTDILPVALPLQMCSEMLIKLAEYL